MSTLEKNLYKRVTVPENNQNSPRSGRAYRGFSTVDINRDNFALYDLELIKQDIINHFHIRQGELLSDPEFGTIIWDVLYEPFTEDVKEAIIQNVTDIVNYDPRVGVNSITIDTYESGILIDCEVTYVPYNISEALRFRFDQKAGLL
jgi:phage baseplate assembly protein W